MFIEIGPRVRVCIHNSDKNAHVDMYTFVAYNALKQIYIKLKKIKIRKPHPMIPPKRY